MTGENVESISRTGVGKSSNYSASADGPATNQFTREIKLAKAGEILRHTDQYEKWTLMCQKNDALAFEMADILIQRHEILEQAKAGRSADWKVFDTLTKTLQKNNIKLLKSSEIIRQNPQIAGPAQITEDNLLVLNAQYKHYVLNNGLIGYGDNTRLYLPLSEISKTLDFNIHVDAENKTASGWFVSEDRHFMLDMEKNEVVADGKKFQVPQESILPARREFYVKTDILSQWFPVNFNYDFSNQSVMVQPREKLAFQTRIEREQAWKSLKGSQISEPVFPREHSEYSLLSPPAVDIGLATSYTNGTYEDDGIKSGFYLLSKGDLGKMTSEVYLSGDDEEGLENSRFTLRRDDPDGKLLGPLKAKSITAGDIRTTDIPIISGGETERGFGLSNEKFYAPRQFDTTFFEGNLPPGWDVEVYRNNVLINTQRVGADGRYSFNEIPLYYGKNEFELKFFGPQGQEKIETKRIDVGNDLLKKGEGEYSISVTQKDSLLYDPEKIGTTKDEETLKLNAKYNYGLGKNLSVGAGLSSQEVYEDRRNYLNLGLKGNVEGMYLSGDYLHDMEGGDAVELFAQTGLGGFDLNLRQRLYSDFIDDRGVGFSDPLESETSLSVSGKIDENRLLPDIPFTLTYKDTQKENSHYSIFGSRTALNIKNINLNNYLQWTDRDTVSGDSTVWDGNFQAIMQAKDLRIRGSLEYEISPKTELTKAELSNLYTIDDHLSSELVLKQDMDEDVSEGLFKLNFNNGKYILSPQVSYNSKDEFQALLSFSTSLGLEPRSKKIHASSMRMADKGGVSVKVYNDKNNNKVFDKGDEVIKGASVKAVQSNREATTNDDGTAFISMLSKNRPTDVVLDRDTLEDPFWEPTKPGRSIVPRPGHVQQIEIPVTTTGEIDGTVLSLDEDGNEIILPNVLVQLRDSNGKVVQEVKSEYDGFYYFQKVFPGKYSVRIDPYSTLVSGKKFRIKDIEISTEDNVASGLDLYLKEKPDRLASGGVSPSIEKSAQSIEPPGKTMPTEKVEKMEAQKSTGTTKPVLAAVDKESAKPQVRKESTLEIPVFKIPSIEDLKAAKPVEEKPSPLPGASKYGLHLTSYRTPEKAIAGINHLLKTHKGMLERSDFTIKKVNVSKEKGTWYRVIAGAFTDEKQAKKLEQKIKMSSPYCKVVSLDEDLPEHSLSGVHLTSFRTRKKALLSIDELKTQYPSLLKNVDFTIRDVDLGPKLGKWKRVVAGSFANRHNASMLAKKIKMQQPYCKPVKIEKDNEFGLHLASYRTPEKASNGLKQLQREYGSLLADKDLAIRKVNLGDKKGVWFRIFAGRFKEKFSGIPLKYTLNDRNQYAEIRSLSR